MAPHPHRPASRAFAAANVIVVAVALALAATWALRAPFFLQPDERAHLDYALGLFDAGRPFKTVPATPAMDVTPQERYVDASIDFRRLRYDPTARVRSDYGTRGFVAAFDAGAPQPSDRIPSPGSSLPYIAFLYPVLYYSLVAGAMRLADAFGHGALWYDLLAARAVGVVLLGCTLALAGGVFRTLRFTRMQTTLALVAIGWLPLASWVAGYVQPDNLSFALVTLALFGTVRWQARPTVAVAVGLAVVFGALFFTKQHYALCAWVGALATVLPRLISMPKRNAFAIAIPLVAVPFLCFKASFFATYAPSLSYAAGSFAKAGTTMSPAHLAALAAGYRDGVFSAFLGGDSFRDYWTRFGERSESLFPRFELSELRVAIAIVMLAIFGFAAVYQMHVARRIANVARRRSWLTGVRLATALPALNIYALTAFAMIFAFVQSNETIWLEGRYWLPLIVPMIVLAVRAANAAPRRARMRVRTAMLGSFAAFSCFAAINGVVAIDREYYRPASKALAFVPLAAVTSVRAGDSRTLPGGLATARRGETLLIEGYAVDPHTGLGAASVFARIDGDPRVRPAAVGLACPLVAGAYSDDRLQTSCFSLRLPADVVALGRHRLRVYVARARARPLPLRDAIEFQVDPLATSRTARSVKLRT